MKMIRIGCVFGGLLSLALSLSAQTFTTLFSFDAASGAPPFVELIQATDGNLYSTTNNNGANGGGTVFKITPSGTLTTLYSFCALVLCADGRGPYGGWSRRLMGTSTGLRILAGPTSSMGQYSRSHRAVR